KTIVIGLAAGLMFVAFAIVAPNLGSEFVPRLSEGALAISIVRLTGTALEDSIQYNTQMERTVLAEFPNEVDHVWSRIGSAEIATDPMGIELTDMFITLKPRNQWQKAHDQSELTELIEHHLRDLPGQRLEFLQPIEMRINEMVSGVRADVAIKLYGDDLDVLTAKGKEIEAILNQIPGNADVASEQITGQPVLQIKLNQQQLARYGVPAKVITDIIESIGSKPLGEVIEGQLRFPLVVRLPDEMRAGSKGIGSITVPTAAGERLPLSTLADIRVVEGPSTITREWGQRRITVTANVRGRDMGSFVAEAQQRMKDKFTLPPGRYFYEFGGQFEHLERAKMRLLIVVPVSLLLIFGLLYVTYQNWIDVLRVFSAVPFGWVGGIFALWIRGMPFSISAAIGFIALSGVAVLDAMILVSYIRQLRAKGMSLEQAVEDAATTRLRPVLMTTLVASLGFIPMAFSTGMGAEVQRPLATVVIGGVISAMIMSLLVLRVLYLVFYSPSKGRRQSQDSEQSQNLSSAAAL
ncbi:MAG TPA: efflux RND transporter permease subunit, partial [Pirellulales bacterium]